MSHCLFGLFEAPMHITIGPCDSAAHKSASMEPRPQVFNKNSLHQTEQSWASERPCCSPFRSTSLMSQPAALSLTPQICTQTHIRAQTDTHYTPLSLRGINQRTNTTDSLSVQVSGYLLGALNKRSSKSETDLNNRQCEHQSVCPADILHRHIWLCLMCYSVPPVGLWPTIRPELGNPPTHHNHPAETTHCTLLQLIQHMSSSSLSWFQWFCWREEMNYVLTENSESTAWLAGMSEGGLNGSPLGLT
jgi:hypothetical protein